MPHLPSLPGRTLLLFNHDWDAIGHTRARQSSRHPVDEDGFDLFSFPSNAQLAFFDMERWVDRLASRAPKRGWTAVVSHHEQFGALAAALLAERMGWPGTPVNAILSCQHKFHARQVLQQVAPEANVPFTLLDAEYGEPVPAGLTYPAFVKPVKAAFSVLAREVRSHDELHRHTRFGAWELWVIRRLVEPFERLSRQRLGPDVPSAHRMMLEQPVHAAQYNLDGYVFEGQLHPIGVVDAIMYPGTQAFMRHQLPTHLPQAVQDRAADVARRFLAAVGFTHGLFNMEFFYDEALDRLSVIEFNPRMASQYSDLYLRVLGIDLHAIGLALAHGLDPACLPRSIPQAGAAASFVYRQFDPNEAVVMPGKRQQQAFGKSFPDGLLFCYPKSAASVARDHKWLGSWRYGIVHLAGRDEAELRQRCEQASGLLGWPAPYAELPMSVAVGSSAGAPHASTLSVAPAIRAWP
jgi:biotin carboxylase